MARASAKKSHPRPIVLMLIEGFGIAPEGEGNAIASAATPFFDSLISAYPTGTLHATGELVGLSSGILPNSQTGHYCVGHGRPWIDMAQIISERFDNNQVASESGFGALQAAIAAGNRRIHLMGLVSNVEQESSARHIKGLIDFLAAYPDLEVFIHCILDGRESSATAGQRLVQEIEVLAKSHPKARVVSLIGRMYGLDAKNNIARTQKAKDLLCEGEANFASSVEEACTQAYEKKIFDEEFPPTIIAKDADRSSVISDNDIVITWNHSGQSFAQLIQALSVDLKKSPIFTLTDYQIAGTQPLFSIEVEANSLGQVIAERSLRQLRIGDSAGFSGAGFWLDGGKILYNETVERQLVPIAVDNNIVASLSDSVREIKRLCIESVNSANYDFIAVTLSQLDTIAHQGTKEEVIAVVEAMDAAVKAMAETIEAVGGILIISSSHGFAERLVDPATGLSLRTHSQNPVLISLVSKVYQGFNLGWPEPAGGNLSAVTPIGSLIDIAPTILALAGLKAPSSMIGRKLI